MVFNSCVLQKYVAVIALLLITGCGIELTDIEHVQRAKDYQDEGDLVSAIIELKSAASKNPKNPEARLILGRIYLVNGNGAAAEKELSMALKLGINDPQVELDLHESKLIQDKYDEVITQLEMDRYLTDADKSRALAIVGNAYVGNQKYLTAKSILDKSLVLKNNASARVGLAKLHFRNENYVQALENIKLGLKDFPQDFDMNIIAADYYSRENDYQKSITHYTNALSIRKNINALLLRADTYIAVGDLAAAKNDLNTILSAEKKHPLANFIRAKIEYQQKNNEGARDYLERVLSVLPGHTPTFLLLGVVNYHIGNYEQAAVQLEKYLSRVGANADAQRLLAEIYVRSNRPEQAIKLLTDLSAGTDNDPASYALLANAYMQTKNITEAKKSLSKAYSLDRSQSSLGQQLATLKMISGDNAEAAEDLESILTGENANRRAESLLIWALLNSNQLDKATEFAKQGVESSPDDPLRLFMMGVVNKQKGSLEAARANFKEAIKKDDVFYFAYIALAEIELLEDNISQSRELLKQVLTVNERHVGAMYGLALLDYKEKDLAGAVAWLEKSIGINPMGVRAINTLTDILIDQGDADRLLKIGRDFQNKNPANPLQYYMIGVAQAYKHNYVEAEANLQRYIDNNPSDIKTRMFLVEVASRLESSDKLLMHVDLLLKQQPENSYLLAIKAKSLLKSGQVEEATALVNQLERQNFSNNLVSELRGDIHFSQKSYDLALKAYEDLFRTVKTYNLGLKLSRLYVWLNRHEDAEKTLEVLLSDNPQDTTLRLTLASLFSQNGKLELAADQYEKILEQEPNNLPALNNKAMLYLDMGKHQDALALAEKAYARAPGIGAVLDTLGWILLKNGREKEALDKLKAAVRAKDANSEIEYHYAVALYENRDFEAARSLLRRLAEDASVADQAKQLLQQIGQE